ncbi:hypothetical protein SDC9_116487 [bioreactor metagenome]|uniref:Uncharacterized protein n=1 Tax=bioreactor metagenome TaxID=1076179 RepID=A0A645BW88_9ZZZZ
MRANLRSAADGDVTANSNLSAQHTTFAYFGRSCNSYLSRHNRILSNLTIVCDLDQIIEFYSPTNDGRSHDGTIYSSVGANFHIVLQHHIAHLLDFVVDPFLFAESEAVCANNGP